MPAERTVAPVVPDASPKTTAGRAPTGVVFLNLGGPETLDQVEPFLLALFDDREIIKLPFQSLLGPYIAKRRAPMVRENYRRIGGGSPILKHTRAQAAGLIERLDARFPNNAPHKAYIAFRYVTPTADDALRQMAADGVRRAVAFSQYPQFSCTTTGSSLNELWRAEKRLGLTGRFDWSIIDRWPTHPGFVKAMANTVRDAIATLPEHARETATILFSAHSLPLSVIEKGDHYPQEMGATVAAVIAELRLRNPYLLSYQSEVGPVKWLGPSTERVIRELPQQGVRDVIVVPIAFTSDHIETLSELDLEYGEVARHAGYRNYIRAAALNDRADFLDALGDIVAEHLCSGERSSVRYGLKCPGCTNAGCRTMPAPVAVTAG
ncbi:MAG: ferrochelatase [Gemmatimonadetes bacterium]|nr:ferrochelatase [Gemmatimonadota bacterium]